MEQSGLVTLYMLLMDSTHHLINGDKPSLVKPTVYLVKAVRGAVIK
ncbi:MAG: hypothetical protein KAW00_02345 [Dehalococcoidia bacterium]|nr:hypothetical protein [Dehalococcoidia bacterium]